MSTKLITRRTLLKGVVAGIGSIAAASFLPEKWVKPVVSSGVLPVHAQASGEVTVTGTVNSRNPDSQNFPPPYSYSPMWSGITVSVVGFPLLTSLTDDNGRYTIHNVPTGSRDIQVDDTGWLIVLPLDIPHGDTQKTQALVVNPGVNTLNFYFPVS
jgi:hypothetical protein